MKVKKLVLKPVPFAKLLPNMVTLVGLIVGASSIRFALDAAWEKSLYCILIAAIIDGLDGRVARILNATSHFGAELDSLCDFVNFGMCPALILYLWSFQQYEYKVMSWASVMIFIVCMAVRLARFNTSITDSNDDNAIEECSKFFKGIPAPSGAILVLMPIILDFEVTSIIHNFSIRNHTLYINMYTILVASMLASRVPTLSLKKTHISPEYLSFTMMVSAISIITVLIYPWYSLPILSILYILSIPACMYYDQKSN